MAIKSHNTRDFPETYKPLNVDQHKDGVNKGKAFDAIDSGVSHHSSPPTINYGDKSGWSTYSRISNAGKKGVGWHSLRHEDGSVHTNWGSTGSKHTEIFRVGGNHGNWLTIGSSDFITGCGFEMRRKRTDSSSNNNNAQQHCIFLKRWGVEFGQRAGGSTKFWSSGVLNTDGNFNGGTTSGSTISQYYYYRTSFNDYFRDSDYVVKALWFNTAAKDGSYTGTATTDLWIFNFQLYHEMRGARNVNNRWLKPAWRSWGDRNKGMIQFS